MREQKFNVKAGQSRANFIYFVCLISTMALYLRITVKTNTKCVLYFRSSSTKLSDECSEVKSTIFASEIQ